MSQPPEHKSGLSARDRLIFPLDYPSLKEAERAAVLLRDHVGLFKVGLELFVAAGTDVLKMVAEQTDRAVFLDLKFHDIPGTVRGAARATNAFSIEYITVHAAAGRGALRAAVDETRSRSKILAVTVLTSLEQEDLSDIGIDRQLDPRQLVLQRARIARETGCAGVVCSGEEVRAIKEQFGRELITVVPGIRPDWYAVQNDDQQRVTTPRAAIHNGADYLVVGRPIRAAKNPAAAAKRTLDEIKFALMTQK